MYKVQQHRIEGGGADWAPYDPDSRVLAEAQGRTMAEALRKNGVGLEELPQPSIVDVLAADGGGDSLARQSKAATFKRRRRFLVSTAGSRRCAIRQSRSRPCWTCRSAGIVKRLSWAGASSCSSTTETA